MTNVFDASFDAAVRGSGQPVGQQSILVSNEAEFNAAMDTLSAGNGGTIRIASDADPMQVFVRDAGSDTGKIVVTSEDPDNPSHMVTARVLDSHDVSFENLHFESTGFARTDYLTDAYVVNSKDIAFVNNTFKSEENGPLVQAGDTGENMSFFKNVDGLLLEGNQISGYVHGLRIFDSNDVLVENNNITELQGDALHGGGWQDVKISNNHIHDLYGSSQLVSHSDMIQLWGGFGLEPTDGVLITGNLLDSADGAAYQSIFIRNTAEGITHENIRVEDNLIYNGHPNGIRISGAEGTVVDGNTLLWNQGSSLIVDDTSNFDGEPQITVDDSSGLIVNNISGKITGLNGTKVGDNGIISYANVTASDHISKHFVSLEGGGARSIEELQLTPDSTFVGAYGSSKSLPTDTAATLTPVFTQTQVEGTRGSIVLDASLTRDESGYLDETEATFTWTFGDGVTLRGVTVGRSFATGDETDIILTVTRTDNTTATTGRTVSFDRNDIADVDFSAGLAGKPDFYSFFNSSAADFETSGGNTVFHMDGSNGVQFKAQDSAWGGLDAFSMDFDISKDSAGGTGRILNLQQAMKMYVDGNGRVIFELTTDEGLFTVASENGALGGTEWHNVNVTYDDVKDDLKIYIDDQLSGSVKASGTTAGQGAWGLQLGAHQHSGSIAARIDNFNVAGNPDAKSGVSEGGQQGPVPTPPTTSPPDQTPTEPPAGSEGGDIADVDFTSGLAGDPDTFTFFRSDAADFETSGGNTIFHMDGSNGIQFDAQDSAWGGLDAFSMDFDISKDSADGTGRILNLQQAMKMYVDGNGRVIFQLTTDEGLFTVASENGALGDTGWHNVNVTYDDVKDDLELYIDGQLSGAVEASGTTAEQRAWGLQVGAHQHSGSIAARIDNFNVDNSPEPTDSFDFPPDQFDF